MGVVSSSKETTTTTSSSAATGAVSSVSPARPPPGLSIGGMPPMPASAVMVHELENNLESASLNVHKNNSNEQAPAAGQSKQASNTSSTAQSSLPSGITQQSYNQQLQLQQQQQQQQHHQQQQGMPSMYNYTAAAAAAGSGFAGMQPVLAGMPQQHQQAGKPHGAGIGDHNQNGPQGSLHHQGLYSSQVPTSVQSSTTNTNRGVDSTPGVSSGDNTSAATAATANVPPGMPGAIPYANPALHYGAQQAAAQQQAIGYNYGYAGHAQQFGGAVQGGFGYPQVMGQNQGYGASHYDDQGHQVQSHQGHRVGHQGNSHHSGSSGYQNKSGGGGGGYRGRNTHNNNQYQNHYNPQQHGGYGGQSYGMGYQGHTQGAMTDPYAAMQQQQHQQHGGIQSGFQDNDHQKE